MDSDDSNLGTAMADQISPEKKKRSKSSDEKRKKKKNKKQRVEATIQVLEDRPDQAPPIVGYFPSGFNPESADSTGARVFRHANKTKRLQLVVTPSDSNVDFVGTNYLGEAEAGQNQCNYVLGVFDKETQTLKIVPIASNKLFRLDPKVRGVDTHKKEPETSEGGESTLTKAESIREMNKHFGTKKALRAMAKWDELRKEEDPMTKKEISEKLEELNVKAEEVDAEGNQAQLDRNIPPYHSEANSPQEAYPLNKIILKGDSEFLDDIYRTLEQEGEGLWDNYPSFISSRINRLREIQDDEERRELAVILSYISHLINFKDSHSMGRVAEAKSRKLPGILRQRFSSRFEDDTEWKKLSPQKNDLLISYVLVLALHADNFHTSISDISKDLRINALTLRGYFEHLGCKLVRENKLLFATLPVPIRFPELRQRRRTRF